MSSIFVTDQLRRRAGELETEAEAHEGAGRRDQAADTWRQLAKVVRTLAGESLTQDERLRRFKKANEFEARAEAVAKGVRHPREPGREPVPAADEYRATVDELIYRSSVTWDDIGGMELIKNAMKYAMGLCLAKRPDGVDLDVPSRFLLYGPPGTGKTLLAAACSNMLGARFFNVKASNLLSKWFGESSKLVSALYARARSEADLGVSVVFIDEIDALCRKTEMGDSGAERRILATLLAELDGLSEKGDRGDRAHVITIAATNQPWDMHEPILQRFEKHFLVDLPDQASREAIFKVHITRRGLGLDQGITWDDLARETQGCSGRNIQHICKDAVESMVNEMNQGVPSRVDGGTIRDYTLAMRPLTRRDFEPALTRARPRSGKDVLARYRQWAEQSGG